MTASDDSAMFEMPSYREWLNDQNAKLDAEGVAPSVELRGWRIAGETPLKFFLAVSYRSAANGTRDYLRRQNRRAVRRGESGQSYLTPEQMTLPEIQAFLLVNYDRRIADVRAERQFVKDWCDAHTSYTPSQIYALAGVRMPSLPKASTP